MTDLTKLTLADALDGLKAKKFSSREITQDFIQTIEGSRILNAYVVETPEKALDMADKADARLAKGEGGRLEGAPIGVKDLYCTKGVRTTACSNILGEFTPTYESTVTQNLWDEGAVMLGKLNMDEFAMGSSNETSRFGPPINPWRRKGDNAGPDAGRFLGRVGFCCLRRSLPCGDGFRHGRFHPPAGSLYRHRRHQADLRPGEPLGHGGVCVLARPGRPDCEDG
jgi:Asp-tRNA(Asn)/Glu-tRNA(Gln) amidotransferase A subunit family amidase